MKILIVDDAPDIRQLLEHILRKEGYEDLEFAVSGEEVLEKVSSKLKNKEELDLILLDVVLPDINGIKVCQQLKRRPELQDVPVIMVTGKEDEETLKEAFAAGAVDYITKPLSQIELRARVSSALRLRKEIKRRNNREEELEKTTQKLERANRKLERLASVDGLTGLANRRLFDEVINREWQRAYRENSCLGLIMLDIDHFKNYNDFYGHQAGDKCLQQVAARLANSLVRPGDVAARYGGEEFAAILPEADLEGAKTVAERIRQEIADLKVPHEKSPVAKWVTVSIGAAVAEPNGQEGSEKLIKAADEALYEAKEAGRNQVQLELNLIT
jgi:diguanylate cyclase (GGDEF)-like protein